MIKILFVCHGNICRSTMAEYVMKDLVKKEGMQDRFYISSAGTSREEIGNGVHYGTRRKLREEGIPVGNHRAVLMCEADYRKYDYLIGMDSANMRNMERIVHGDSKHKLYLLLDFTSRPGAIADPWYTGNFDATFTDVMEGCSGLLKYLKSQGTDENY